MSIDWVATQGIATLIATTVSAVATVILALLTAKYVRFTASMVEEMREAREPAVYVDLVFPDGHDAELIIGNNGVSAARSLRLSLTEALPWHGRAFLDRLAILKEGMPYLAPGRKLQFYLGSIDWEKLKDSGGTLQVSLSF